MRIHKNEMLFILELDLGLGFALGKSLWKLQTCPRVTLRTLRIALGTLFLTNPSDFPLFVLDMARLLSTLEDVARPGPGTSRGPL